MMGTSDTAVYDTQCGTCFQSILQLGAHKTHEALYRISQPAGLRLDAKLGVQAVRKWLRAQKSLDDHASGFCCLCEIGWSALYRYPSSSKP